MMILATSLILSFASNVGASMFRPDQAEFSAHGDPTKTSQEKKLANLEKNMLNMVKKSIARRDGDDDHDEMSNPSQIIPLLDDMETQVNGGHGAAQKQIDTLIESFGACNTTRGTADKEADAAKVVMDNTSTVHKTCRQTEGVVANTFITCNATYHTELLAKDAACGRFAEVVKIPNVNLVPNVATEWVPWLHGIRDWAIARLNETEEWSGKCQQATQAVDAKKLECEGPDGTGGLTKNYTDSKAACDIVQTQLEGAACSYAEKFDAACENHHTCYNTTKATYDKELESIKQMESGRQREWWMIKRIKCYLKVMSNRGSQADLNACSTEEHNIDHLTLTYPAIPAGPAACTPAQRPCDAAYVAAEYSGFVVPTLPCSVCGGGVGGGAPGIMPVQALVAKLGFVEKLQKSSRSSGGPVTRH